MNLSLENIINQKLHKIFNELNLDEKFATVKVSDRPDLSDFQCNGALALAKQERKIRGKSPQASAKCWRPTLILQRFQSTDRVLSTCR